MADDAGSDAVTFQIKTADSSTTFKVKKNTLLSKVFAAWCASAPILSADLPSRTLRLTNTSPSCATRKRYAKTGFQPKSHRFVYDNNNLKDEDTVKQAEIEDGTDVDAIIVRLARRCAGHSSLGA